MLIDDIVQRISNLLTTDKPSVILDLNPSRGLLSTKIHDLLKPDRHVLVEPRLQYYERHLKPLLTRDGVELHGEKLHYEAHKGIGWMSLLNKYLAGHKEDGENDLLIIANLTDIKLKNASRIWAALIGHSLLGTGHFRDWRIRALLILPPDEADLILPHSAGNRKKVAFLNDAYSRHALYVAETDNAEYIMPRGLELVEKSAARVAQCTAENGIHIPEGRGRPALESFTEVPASAQTGKFTLSTPIHAGAVYRNYVEKKKLYEDAMKEGNADEKRKSGGAFSRARASLVHDAKTIVASLELAKEQLEVDQFEKAVVKAKMDPEIHSAAVDQLNTTLMNRRSNLVTQISSNGARVSRTISNWINNYRVALGTSGDITDSGLTWDQRPFEPLYIRPDEVAPGGKGLSIMYIEPEPRDVLVKKFAVDVAHHRHDEAVEIALSIIGAFGIRGNGSVADMLDKLFPGRPFMEILDLVPELFPYIPKQLRPSSSSSSTSSTANSSEHTIPEPSMTNINTLSSSSPCSVTDNVTAPIAYKASDDTATIKTSLIHNEFSYFPDQINLRCLPTHVLLLLLRLYLKTSDTKSFVQVNRSLGGSATMYSLRSWVVDKEN